ncbi:uncharacterized protein [Eucyclogobius newberryi]|uniref:uncharacterized protein n=1 Tax=Eucyclogobius newberryi TaxID=166745 RepID=UPI003B593445
MAALVMLELCDRCACDNRSTADPNFSQLKAIIPSQYESRLCCFKDHPSDNGFSATLRLPIGTKEEAMKWKREFQETSKTILRLSKTYPHVCQKVIFREDLRCRHNTRRSYSKDLENIRPSSKDTQCKATMTIVVKRTGIKRTRSTDRHLPKFPMIVNMRFIHNHPLNCADVQVTSHGAVSSPTTAETTSLNDSLDGGSEVQEVKESLMTFSNSLMSKVENDPTTFLPAVKSFLASSQKLKTDSALISALHTFGKYCDAASSFSTNRKNKLSTLKRKGVQPTAVARRKKAAL